MKAHVVGKLLLVGLVLISLAIPTVGSWVKSHHRRSVTPMLEANVAGGSGMQGGAASSRPASLTADTRGKVSSTFTSEAADKSMKQSVPLELQAAYQQVGDFARSGEVAGVTNLTTANIRALATFIASNADRSQILSLLQSSVQMPPELIPEDAEALAGFLGNWFQAVRGDKTNEVVPAAASAPPVILPIGFSSTTDDSGRIIATVASFPAGVQKICGVFESRWWPTGLSQVLAVWRNTDQNMVVFQQTEPILTAADSNYVWLFNQDGWSAGHWQLDLFDPTRNFSLLATGTFTTQ